jgi:hypothetical protein
MKLLAQVLKPRSQSSNVASGPQVTKAGSRLRLGFKVWADGSIKMQHKVLSNFVAGSGYSSQRMRHISGNRLNTCKRLHRISQPSMMSAQEIIRQVSTAFTGRITIVIKSEHIAIERNGSLQELAHGSHSVWIMHTGRRGHCCHFIACNGRSVYGIFLTREGHNYLSWCLQYQQSKISGYEIFEEKEEKKEWKDRGVEGKCSRASPLAAYDQPT